MTSVLSGFDTLVTAVKNGVQAISGIQTAIGKIFPQATGTATTATGGSATLPSAPVGFIQVFIPSLNATVKIPYYNS